MHYKHIIKFSYRLVKIIDFYLTKKKENREILDLKN